MLSSKTLRAGCAAIICPDAAQEKELVMSSPTRAAPAGKIVTWNKMTSTNWTTRTTKPSDNSSACSQNLASGRSTEFAPSPARPLAQAHRGYGSVADCEPSLPRSAPCPLSRDSPAPVASASRLPRYPTQDHRRRPQSHVTPLLGFRSGWGYGRGQEVER